MKLITRLTLLTFLIFNLIGCGGGGGSDTAVPPVPVVVPIHEVVNEVVPEPIVVEEEVVVVEVPVVVVPEQPLLNVLVPLAVSYEIDVTISRQAGETGNSVFNRYLNGLYVNTKQRFIDESILIDVYLKETGNLYDSSHNQLYIDLSKKMVEASVIAIKAALKRSDMNADINQVYAIDRLIAMREGFKDFMTKDAFDHLAPFGQDTDHATTRIETDIHFLFDLLANDLRADGIIL